MNNCVWLYVVVSIGWFVIGFWLGVLAGQSKASREYRQAINNIIKRNSKYVKK